MTTLLSLLLATATATARPNDLLDLADDLGVADHGCSGELFESATACSFPFDFCHVTRRADTARLLFLTLIS